MSHFFWNFDGALYTKVFSPNTMYERKAFVKETEDGSWAFGHIDKNDYIHIIDYSDTDSNAARSITKIMEEWYCSPGFAPDPEETKRYKIAMEKRVLTRDDFRESVFKRDEHKCVVCKKPAKDAHHIMERRLFPDGGYYLDNGASLCEVCHLEAEKTTLTTGFIRFCAQIKKIVLPPHLYNDLLYDKWGNIINPDNTRIKGELFYDPSVQKILRLGNVLELFQSDAIKYPRTHHLPWSPGMHKDDRMLDSMDNFKDRRVIVTEKLDGENTTLYNNYNHARSIDSVNHESRNWVKNFWSQIAHDIPSGFRVCGENMFATHSIKYDSLKTYFYGFSFWNDQNHCLSWDDTLFWFELLGITPVPVLYDDIYDEQKIKDIWKGLDYSKNEGYVLRIADEFPYSDFRKSVGKFVRNKHINTVKHWMYGQKMEVNQLQKES